MNPELEETIIVDFITSSPTTGAATDADSTPTCAVYEETNDTAILTPTVVKRTSLTGNYRVPVACTAANGFEAGKSYAVIISATVGGVAAKAVAKNFQMRTNGPDDISAALAIVDDFLDTEIAAIKTKTDNLPADTAATLTTIDDFLDTEIAAIKAKTDNLPAAPAAVGDIPTALQNADQLLKRDMSAVTGESARSLLNAIRFLRNKWTLTAGTLSVKKEDDSTEAWNAAVTTDAAAVPIIGSDPA